MDSNPANEHVVSWLRRKNDSNNINSIMPISSTSSGSSISFDDDADLSSASVYNRMHSEVEILTDDGQHPSQTGEDSVKIKSSLLIINATLQDSGTSFDCIANNGIGKESKSTVTLLVLRMYSH